MKNRKGEELRREAREGETAPTGRGETGRDEAAAEKDGQQNG